MISGNSRIGKTPKQTVQWVGGIDLVWFMQDAYICGPAKISGKSSRRVSEATKTRMLEDLLPWNVGSQNEQNAEPLSIVSINVTRNQGEMCAIAWSQSKTRYMYIRNERAIGRQCTRKQCLVYP